MTERSRTGKIKMVVKTISTEPSRQLSQSATLLEYRSAAERKIWPHCTMPPMMLPRNMITMQISVNSCGPQIEPSHSPIAPVLTLAKISPPLNFDAPSHRYLAPLVVDWTTSYTFGLQLAFPWVSQQEMPFTPHEGTSQTLQPA